jgi:hypothetical protein
MVEPITPKDARPQTGQSKKEVQMATLVKKNSSLNSPKDANPNSQKPSAHMSN